MVINATLNTTLNETLNTTTGVIASKATNFANFLGVFIPLVLFRLWDIIAAPFRNSEMLWIIFPLALTFIVLEFYFDRHGTEELGWAAAVANSLILFIVAIDLIKHSFHYAPPWKVAKVVFLAVFTKETLPIEPQVLILIVFLALLGIFITIVNYFHLLPKKMAFEVSGHPPINFLAFFAIVVVYSTDTAHPVPLDIPALIAGVLLYLILLFIVFSVRRGLRNKLHGSGGRTWVNS